MATPDEAVVRRFYEEMCNGRDNALAAELFAHDHRFHDPQVDAVERPQGIVEAVSTYQRGLDGPTWQIEEMFLRRRQGGGPLDG